MVNRNGKVGGVLIEKILLCTRSLVKGPSGQFWFLHHWNVAVKLWTWHWIWIGMLRTIHCLTWCTVLTSWSQTPLFEAISAPNRRVVYSCSRNQDFCKKQAQLWAHNLVYVGRHYIAWDPGWGLTLMIGEFSFFKIIKGFLKKSAHSDIW